MAVIFWDFDGTLVCSNHLWSGSVYNALKETVPDTDVAFSEIRKCMAKGFTWHTPNNDYSNFIGDKWWYFMIDKICNDYISMGVEKEKAVAASLKVPAIIKNIENYNLYPDTILTLKRSIKAGNINVILSNNYPDLEDVIIELGLSEYFDRIIVSALEGYDKPRKELFDIAKSYYPAQEYIMIGDNISADILGGKNAGMKTILVHNGFSENADVCAENLSDIDFKSI